MFIQLVLYCTYDRRFSKYGIICRCKLKTLSRLVFVKRALYARKNICMLKYKLCINYQNYQLIKGAIVQVSLFSFTSKIRYHDDQFYKYTNVGQQQAHTWKIYSTINEKVEKDFSCSVTERDKLK